MKRKRFSVEQITGILKQADQGTRIREIASAHVRFGYWRIFVTLRREGWDVGKDRFYRVYCEENLGLRRKRPWRHVSAVHREQRPSITRANEA